MASTEWEVRPLAGRIGAEIAGLDLSRPLDDRAIEEVRSLLLLWEGALLSGLGGEPDILSVDAHGGNVAVQWHTDVTFVDRPPLGSILRAVVVPPYGGDTLWANTAAAYEDLPQSLRTLAESLFAVHTNQFDYVGPTSGRGNEALQGYAKTFQSVRFETAHPVVRVHPETQEKALLLGGFARRIEGLSAKDSTALLRLFHGHIERPENVVRWRWRPGDVAFWDNRTTQHRAIHDFGGSKRQLHRVTIAGDLPTGADGRTSKALVGDSTAYLRATA